MKKPKDIFQKKAFIFDFDGVIVHSIEVKTKAFVSLYEIYGKTIVKKVVKHHELNGGMSRTEKFKFYHKHYLNKVLNEEEINSMEKKFSKIVIRKVIEAEYLNGVLNFIKNLNKKKLLFISTGTPESEIKIILKEKNIYHYFDGIYGSPNSKVHHINSIQKKFKLNNDELIFFGDSSVDFKSAKIMNIEFILLKNKYNRSLVKIHNGLTITDFNELN